MTAEIDWYYHRKNCVTCKRSQEFLERAGVTIKQQINAAKERLGPEEALRLVKAARHVYVAKGHKLVHFDMKSPPDDEQLLKAVIGPSGNLRAPTIRRGNKLFVGFNAEGYQSDLFEFERSSES